MGKNYVLNKQNKKNMEKTNKHFYVDLLNVVKGGRTACMILWYNHPFSFNLLKLLFSLLFDFFLLLLMV
jgi:hypothetical protein